MELGRWASVQQWWDRGFEAYWKLASRDTCDPVTLTWPVEAEMGGRVEIRWPETYAWEPRRIWGDQVRAALRRFVPVNEVDIPQPHERVINFDFVLDGKPHRVVIETSDYPDLNEKAYAECDLHFKMEYSLEGYGDRDHLLPGGYVNASADIYRYLARLRRIRDQAPPKYEVYGRYGLSMEKRRKPLELLRSSSAFAFYGGKGKVRYSRYLEEMAMSKVCIDLPSMSSITFRMIDSVAIGSCIVGPPHYCQMQHPFVEGVHVAYCKPDYSNLEETCVYYLENEEARLRLIANSRAFFDAYLHREQLGSYYLHHCLERFG